MQIRLRSLAVAVSVGVVMLIRPASSSAQRSSVLGTVVDGVAGERLRAVPGAEVRLTRLDSADVRVGHAGPVVAAHADSAGGFVFLAVDSGAYRLDVRQLGHKPFADTLIVPRDGVVRVRVELPTSVQELERVVTRASAGHRARLLETRGFNDRRRLGFGHFIDPGEIARTQPPTASVYSLLRPYLRGCTMMFVNGAAAPVPQGLTIAELVAVEIYRHNLTAPAQFQNPFSDCGSIVLWTAIPVDEGDASAAPSR